MTKLFKENIDIYFDTVLETIKNSKVNKVPENNLLKLEPIDIAEEITQASFLSTINIDLTNRTSETKMVSIPQEKLPPSYDVPKGGSHPYTCVDYTYRLPKNNECQMLIYEPKEFRPQSNIIATIDNDNLIIHYQTLFVNQHLNDKEQKTVKDAMSLIQDDLIKSVDYLNSDIKQFNDNLKDKIVKMIIERRNEVEKKRNQDNNLNDF